MAKLFLSKFTPSLMSKEDLKTIFVQRSALLTHVTEGLLESVSTANKHHYLFVGPRGIGKTHLMSLLFHNLDHLMLEHNNFIVAWLREEEYVSSFLDLLARIVRIIQESQPSLISADQLNVAFTLAPEFAQEYLVSLLEAVFEQKILIILAENLNQIFNAIGEEGQKRLRAFVQQSSKISIVASTPSLFASVALQTSPFYGFFEIERLSELTLTDAKHLLARIAFQDGNFLLSRFIQSPEGEAKIGAIYHLAGGNHRVYIILSQFINRQNLEDIVEPFLDLLDDLTPYYQSQIAELSPQQRKIMQFLCDRRSAVSVKEIAAQCFITPQTASSQLKDLKEREFVVSAQIGRESRYEVREPLMRFCMEMKQARGEPIRLVVEFLQTWYSTNEINRLLQITDLNNDLSVRYLAKALQRTALNATLECKEVEEEIAKLSQEKKYTEAAELLKDLVSKRGSAEDYDKLGICYALLNQTDEGLRHFKISLTIDPKYLEARHHHQMALIKLGKFGECIELATEAVLKNGKDATAWDLLGFAHIGAGNPTDGLQALERSHDLDPRNVTVLTKIALALITLKRFEEALERLDKALTIDILDCDALILKGFLLGSNKKEKDALAIFNKVINIDGKQDQAWLGKAMVLVNLERYEEGLQSCENAMDLNKQLILAQFWRTLCLFALGRWDAYKKELESLLRRCHNNPQFATSDFGIILSFLLERYSDGTLWTEKITELAQMFSSYGLNTTLASSLGKTISSLVSDDITDKTAVSWVDTCNYLFAGKIEFDISLRLLQTALQFRKTGDRNVALELASEERKLFLESVETYEASRNFQNQSKRIPI